ncbi:hypothetical protein AO1008_02498 [Aspergillus oryzae 100-8]|uniref:Methyltransferase type 11 domain-containing protein n=1 Tax=Aspergillus oryzae (strain 3.042) TaxID=1160506 RepID=I8TJ65_ASPO3|nr:hypothetical protein Ao3042_09935 [Aspergillus oryzae 3.042]KDE77009.1 hypothetical protein AO1008_02498 [Aspergillus oryzae 100-8]|eukprot:EIT74100.1 hypothetical protein Ao3042_09935 [Aspergillus oryzae 3.042]
MLDKYRATAATLGLPESRMMAVQGNILAPMVQTTNPPLDDEELDCFDLVEICMALHHVDDIQLATQRLASRLHPGGVFLIIDWATRGSLDINEHASPDAVHPEHHAAHTISHDSFTGEQIVSLYEQAGCGDVRCPRCSQWEDAIVLGSSYQAMIQGGDIDTAFNESQYALLL